MVVALILPEKQSLQYKTMPLSLLLFYKKTHLAQIQIFILHNQTIISWDQSNAIIQVLKTEIEVP